MSYKRIWLLGFFLLGIVLASRADVLENWTTNQITTNSSGLRYLVYGAGRYVAVGEESDGGNIYSSEDGLTWTQRFSDVDSWGLTMSYSQGHFAGVGGWGIVDISTNGIDWTSAFSPLQYFLEGRSEITYGNGLYVLVGSTNGVGAILNSPDGINFTYSSSTPAPTGPIVSVAFGPGQFVAIGNNDGLEYVSSGIHAGTTWIRRPIAGGNQVSFANGLFFVPLSANSNLVSPNGLSWNLQNTGLTNMVGNVIYANGLYLARSGNYLATSTNGINWIQYSPPLPGAASLDPNLATDGTRLVTISQQEISSGPNSYNAFIYSSDVLVGIRLTNSPARQIALSGLVGRSYQLQSADSLTVGSNGWRTNLTLQLTNTPFYWTDTLATNSTRFYRGSLLP